MIISHPFKYFKYSHYLEKNWYWDLFTFTQVELRFQEYGLFNKYTKFK